MVRVSKLLIFLNFWFTNACVPRPEPSLIGILALPLVTQTSDVFFVESSIPTQNQTGVPVTTVLSFTFSQVLNTDSLAGNLEWSPTGPLTSFSVTPNNRQISLTPNVNFANASVYTIRFKKEIQSTIGKSMQADFELLFTTE